MTARALNTAGVARPHIAHPLPNVSSWGKRFLAYVILLADAWVEARELARAAHRKHPFVEW